MAIQKIQYVDKETLYNLTSIPDKNKCTADDLNEIKQVVNNNADELANAKGQVEYSTTEKVIGTWIDGKPVYRKVVEIGALGNNGTKTVPHGISNLKQVVHTEYNWVDSGTYWWSDYRWDSASVLIKFNITSTDVRIESVGTDWSNRTSDCYAIIEYTKTTD